MGKYRCKKVRRYRVVLNYRTRLPSNSTETRVYLKIRHFHILYLVRRAWTLRAVSKKDFKSVRSHNARRSLGFLQKCKKSSSNLVGASKEGAVFNWSLQERFDVKDRTAFNCSWVDPSTSILVRSKT